jgi:hypothetical protein
MSLTKRFYGIPGWGDDPDDHGCVTVMPKASNEDIKLMGKDELLKALDIENNRCRGASSSNRARRIRERLRSLEHFGGLRGI